MEDLIAGYEILKKYNSNINICAEHDCIYTDCSDETLLLEDKEALDAIGGWHWNTDNDCWAFFT
jgi:hypothetical protein